MSENRTTYLCGGVLFFLLVQAKKKNPPARDRVNGIRSDHNNPTVMRDLIYTVTGSRDYSADKDTSKYMNCLIEGSSNIPFNDPSISTEYDFTVRNSYSDALVDMEEFVDEHIDPARQKSLVKALLELIDQDQSIEDKDIFFILPNAKSVTKEALRSMNEFCLPAFLVGIMHFILLYRRETNTKGVETLDMISDRVERRERRYKGELGTQIERIITVNNQCEAVEEEQIEDLPPIKKSRRELLEEEQFEQMSKSAMVMAKGLDSAYEAILEKHYGAKVDEKIKQEENESEPEAEVVDDEEPSGAAEGEKKVTVIQQQTNVVQNGDNNLNITNNGTMNFNF